MKKKKWAFLLSLVGVLTLTLAGCGFPGLSNSSSNTVRIAAQSTTEQQIVAAIDKQMIEHYTPLKVTIIQNLGSANVSFAALRNGDADISAIRYNGTDLSDILGKTTSHNPTKDNRTAVNTFKNKYHLIYLKSYGFADTYSWMVTQKTAKKYHLNNVSDMKAHAAEMKAGIDQAWRDRRGDGYDGFKQIYGFGFNHLYSMQIGLVYDALASGKMDAVLGYSTDGRISSYNLKMLKDNKHYFPPYEASPVATEAILKKHPELKPVLNKLAGKISVKTMQKLNYQVDNDLEEPDVVAAKFLKTHHYFEGGSN